ncbi:T9SS type A sorting domain-containing protein, partial [Arenimonas sp.]|nr:T9SS type A sorting domain-containing protein [Candidatus Parcubacteria bacterium]
DNSVGQLGDGTMIDRSTPVQVISLCSSITTLESELEQEINSFSVQPNPSNGIFLIKNLKNGSHLQVLNTLGQIELEETITNTEKQISILKPGIYFLKVSFLSKAVTKSLIVE